MTDDNVTYLEHPTPARDPLREALAHAYLMGADNAALDVEARPDGQRDRFRRDQLRTVSNARLSRRLR